MVLFRGGYYSRFNRQPHAKAILGLSETAGICKNPVVPNLGTVEIADSGRKNVSNRLRKYQRCPALNPVHSFQKSRTVQTLAGPGGAGSAG